MRKVSFIIFSIIFMMIQCSSTFAADSQRTSMNPSATKADPNQCVNLEGDELKNCVQNLLDSPKSHPSTSVPNTSH